MADVAMQAVKTKQIENNAGIEMLHVEIWVVELSLC
jgi:hypothetical protein